MVLWYLRISDDLMGRVMVAEMGCYHRTDITVTAKITFLQAYALVRGASISIDRQESSIVEDNGNFSHQALKATQRQE
ncbi:hypothetical protein GUJ93_ZPchr0010g8748 [Zizania palustris]|uniref:Uncharacterized protein n=1 Tax=Zizania palustris TaxID=103762 RepID=A0A8J5WEG7_ZIZPA|nr:hypothetical protein GUJ93_ZPchr0010g8748 [Zizania palustris]